MEQLGESSKVARLILRKDTTMHSNEWKQNTATRRDQMFLKHLRKL